jgi:hypothetical protein
MKLSYWILATVLVAGLAVYTTARESAGVCQMPKSTTYKVFQ